MMMAHDSSPGPALADATVSAVTAALAAYLDAPSQPGQLRQALQHMATEARAKDIQAEQLLVVLKDIWYRLPSVRTVREPVDQIQLLQRVVTMCIREYYAD
jgi:hypothetical protein